MENKPNIWVKSYPYPKEIESLTDLNADGMEVFLSDDKKTSDDILKLCNNNYPRVGVELFHYEDEHKGGRDLIYDPISDNPQTREKSREFLFNSLELSAKHGCTHLQLDGNDGYRGNYDESVKSQKERVVDLKRALLSEIDSKGYGVPVYFENTFTIDDNSPEMVFTTFGPSSISFFV